MGTFGSDPELELSTISVAGALRRHRASTAVLSPWTVSADFRRVVAELETASDSVPRSEARARDAVALGRCPREGRE
jgi:hypothetical protein